MGVDGFTFKCERVQSLPDWIDRLPREFAQLVADNYPQCAVAIGGSAPTLPQEYADLQAPVVPAPPGPRVLPRYQVTGVG